MFRSSIAPVRSHRTQSLPVHGRVPVGLRIRGTSAHGLAPAILDDLWFQPSWRSVFVRSEPCFAISVHTLF